MTLTKSQIAEMIARKNGFAKAKSTELFENLTCTYKKGKALLYSKHKTFISEQSFSEDSLEACMQAPISGRTKGVLN